MNLLWSVGIRDLIEEKVLNKPLISSILWYGKLKGNTILYLTGECTEKLAHAFITSRLDFCNSLPYGVPDHHM